MGRIDGQGWRIAVGWHGPQRRDIRTMQTVAKANPRQTEQNAQPVERSVSRIVDREPVQHGASSAVLRAQVPVFEAILRCARHAGMPQRDRYVKNLKDKARDGRLPLGRQMLAIVFDAIDRGAPADECREPGIAFQQQIEARLAARDGKPVAPSLVDLHALCLAETVAQGAADIAQWNLTQRSSQALAEADARLTAQIDASTALRDAVRRLRYVDDPRAA